MSRVSRKRRQAAQLARRTDAVEQRQNQSLVYNDFLPLTGIPPQVYEYKLGNRSALEWVIDQYQISTDKRSGIVNDPNNPADPQAIVRLIGQVVTVSVTTVRLVNQLPPLAVLA